MSVFSSVLQELWGDYLSPHSSTSPSPTQENASRCSKHHTQRLLASFTSYLLPLVHFKCWHLCPWSARLCEQVLNLWKAHMHTHTHALADKYCCSKHIAFLLIKRCLYEMSELGNCKIKEMAKLPLRLRKSDTYTPPRPHLKQWTRFSHNACWSAATLTMLDGLWQWTFKRSRKDGENYSLATLSSHETILEHKHSAPAQRLLTSLMDYQA